MLPWLASSGPAPSAAELVIPSRFLCFFFRCVNLFVLLVYLNQGFSFGKCFLFFIFLLFCFFFLDLWQAGLCVLAL